MDQHVGAGGVQPPRDRGTDPACPTGDQYDPVLQVRTVIILRHANLRYRNFQSA